MPRLIFESFVLKSDYVFEIDREVVLFTRQRGKIRALGKGGAKIPNRFGSSLEPFTYGEATVWESWKGGLTLETFEIFGPGFILMSSPGIYPYLSLIQEVLLVLLPENLRREKLFDLLKLSLPLINKAPLQTTAYFLFWAAKMEGFPVEKHLVDRKFFREPIAQAVRERLPFRTFISLLERIQDYLEVELKSLSEFKILLKIGN